MPNLRLAAFLAGLTTLALAANAYEWSRTGQVSVALVLPALVLAAMLAILPWTGGRNPAPPTPSRSACHKCGAEHSGGDRIAFCLMCGTFPKQPRAAA